MYTSTNYTHANVHVLRFAQWQIRPDQKYLTFSDELLTHAELLRTAPILIPLSHPLPQLTAGVGTTKTFLFHTLILCLKSGWMACGAFILHLTFHVLLISTAQFKIFISAGTFLYEANDFATFFLFYYNIFAKQ